MLPFGDDDFGKGFFSDVLQHVASLAVTSPADAAASCFVTTRDVFHGTREDVSTESGITMSDESSLLMEARPSPVDLGKQKEIVNMLVKFLQVRYLNAGVMLRLRRCPNIKPTLRRRNRERKLNKKI